MMLSFQKTAEIPYYGSRDVIMNDDKTETHESIQNNRLHLLSSTDVTQLGEELGEADGPALGEEQGNEFDSLQRIRPLEEHNNANHKHLPRHQNDRLQSMIEFVGNVLEWYNFAIMGYFGDVLGNLFFPAASPQQQGRHTALMESFAVFGSAFLMRPLGGIFMGYLGDAHGRKMALEVSLALMALPTFLMGFLPTYERVGVWSYVLMIGVRLLQGFSAGGQLMSSLVYALEKRPKERWGFYGSLTMAGANFGTFLCVFVGFVIRQTLSKDHLYQFGWRIPFLFGGICTVVSCFCLHFYCDEPATERPPMPERHPICLAFAPRNRRALLAASMGTMLWSGGFWFTFDFMAMYMLELIDHPMDQAMGVNASSLLLSVCILFPIAGTLSDHFGRRRIMTVGAIAVGSLSPILVMKIGQGHALIAFLCQSIMGICLSFWGGPMMAWLVESFEPEARLTSVEIGFNIAQALIGGSTLAMATWIVVQFGANMPGFMLTGLAVISLAGLWCVAPQPVTPRHY